MQADSSTRTYVADSDIHGSGLFAGRRIAAGTVIGRLRVRPAAEDGPHVLWLDAKRGVQVTCKLKYINHSDRPNACYYDDLSVVALRDIEAGEEITHDYGCADW